SITASSASARPFAVACAPSRHLGSGKYPSGAAHVANDHARLGVPLGAPTSHVTRARSPGASDEREGSAAASTRAASTRVRSTSQPLVNSLSQAHVSSGNATDSANDERRRLGITAHLEAR